MYKNICRKKNGRLSVRRYVYLSVFLSFFLLSCTDTWCYTNKSSFVLPQTLEITCKIFSVLAHLHRCLVLSWKIFPPTCSDSWSHVTRPTVHWQTVDARLREADADLLSYFQDAWCYVTGCYVLGSRGDHIIGGVAGHQPGPCIYACMHVCMYECLYSSILQ